MRTKSSISSHLVAIAAILCAVLVFHTPSLTPGAAAAKKEPAAKAGPTHLLRSELRRLGKLQRAADQAFRRGRMAAAEEHYREMLAIDPGSTYAQCRVGDCLLNGEQYEQAIAAYEKVGQTPATDAESQQRQASAERLIELARQLQERAAPLAAQTQVSDVEKGAFAKQGLREAQIHAEAHDYGAALRAAAYAESVGREVGAPVSGDEYNDLIVEAVRYHLEAENYGAVAALFEVADYLGIHSRERAELETQFTKLTKGEVQKIQAAAGPYLTALDQEVQQRKAEDAKRDAHNRKGRLTKITSAFAGLLSELVPYVGARRVRLAAAVPATPSANTGKYVHRASRRVDYGKIVALKPADQVLYSIAPLTFYQTPGEWRAWAALHGYEPHEPTLPKTETKGPFIVAREQGERAVGWYYFLLDDDSDKKAKILGRFRTPTDAEKALEYYIANDRNALTGTIVHD